MYNVSEGTKKIYMGQMDDSDYTPVYKIVFPENEDISDITGQNIIAGTPETSKALWDRTNVCLGGCISSSYKVTLSETEADKEAGISEWSWSTNMLGKKIQVLAGFEETEVKCIYEGYIKDGQRQSTRNKIDVVCYDVLTTMFDKDVSSAYNKAFPEQSNYKGVWTQGTTYKSGDIVKDDSDGNYYMYYNYYANMPASSKAVEDAANSIISYNNPSAIASGNITYEEQTGNNIAVTWTYGNITYGQTINVGTLVRCFGDNISNAYGTITCGDLLYAIASYCGYKGVISLPSEYQDKVLYKTMDAQNLSGRACIAQIAESCGRCAFIAESGALAFRKLAIDKENAQFITDFENLTYKDFIMTPIDGVCAKDTEGNTYYYPQNTDGCQNIYTISDNFMLYPPSKYNIDCDQKTFVQDLLQTVYENINGFSYQPFEFETFGMPWLEVGDTVRFTTSEGISITSIIQERTLKGTTGNFKDSYKTYCETTTCNDANSSSGFSSTGQTQGSVSFIINEDIKQIKILYDKVTGQLEIDGEAITDLTLEKADIDLANIDTAKIGKATVEGLLTAGKFITGDMTAASGTFTNWLTGVNILGDFIKAGTISTDRLVINGTDKSIVYALNNMGDLVSEIVDSLDGGVLTERSIAADRIVSKSITTTELATSLLTVIRGENIFRNTNCDADVLLAKNVGWANGEWRNATSWTEQTIVEDVTSPPYVNITKAMKLAITTSTAAPAIVQDYIPVRGGEKYTVSLYAKFNKSGHKVRIKIDNSAGTSIVNITDEFFAATTEWKKYTVTFTSTSEKINVLFGSEVSTASGTILYICGMKLEVGEVDTGYAPSSLDTANASDIFIKGTTRIDGGLIETGTVLADAINVTDLFSKDITASGTIKGAKIQNGTYRGGSGGSYQFTNTASRFSYGINGIDIDADGTIITSGSSSTSQVTAWFYGDDIQIQRDVMNQAGENYSLFDVCKRASKTQLLANTLTCSSITLAGNYDGAVNTTIPTVSGYTPIAVMPKDAGASDVCWIASYLNGSYAYTKLKNTVSSSKTFNPKVYVMYRLNQGE